MGAAKLSTVTAADCQELEAGCEEARPAMATMYPTPLPRGIENDPLRAAERKVYEALEASLGPDHAVFYSVAWLSRNPRSGAHDGEVDFVVAHAERVVLLLEVKGGRICRDQGTGRWTSIDRAGFPHAIRDPFQQARASKHAVIEKLKDHPQFLPALNPQFLPALTEFLAPSVELRQPLRTALADEDRELLRLTEQQFHLLDFLNHGGSFVTAPWRPQWPSWRRASRIPEWTG